MAQKQTSTPVNVIVGGDSFLNAKIFKKTIQQNVHDHPEAEIITLDAADADNYSFDEAVIPTLLSPISVVAINHLEDGQEEFMNALIKFAQVSADNSQSSIIVATHNGSVKGRKYITALKNAGAHIEQVPSLKSDRDKQKFVTQEFARYGRTVQAPAVQQLVSVLGNKTGELSAMIEQLCCDFDDNPLTLPIVMNYLSSTPEVTGFAVADAAISGNSALAILKLRQAIEVGVEPIALIGAIASKLRAMGKAAAVSAGRANAADLKMNGWFLKISSQQVRGWTSPGLASCIQALAQADQDAKSSGADPQFALEQAVELIARKGKTVPEMQFNSQGMAQ